MNAALKRIVIVSSVTVLALSTYTCRAIATTDVCAVVTRTHDGFLSIRTGPDVSFEEMARLPSGRHIVIDDRMRDLAGPWWHVNTILKSDGSVATHISGWVHSRYLRHYPCN